MIPARRRWTVVEIPWFTVEDQLLERRTESNLVGGGWRYRPDIGQQRPQLLHEGEQPQNRDKAVERCVDVSASHNQLDGIEGDRDLS